MSSSQIGYALLGCGAFGQFCLQQYKSLPEVKLIGVADRTADIAERVARSFDVPAFASYAELLAHPEVELVHIATPPGLHRATVIEALEAGKHVLCEKPLAVSLDDAHAMLAAAKKAQRVLVVNLIMRYDPVAQVAGRIIREKLLGEPVHAFFENYAGDEKLSPEHWFWNADEGGGIFIEHGVHFFDLFETWFGNGEVMAAAQLARPGTKMVDQVQCLCKYGENVMSSFYHGFHRADKLEGQEFRIVCERGELKLFEWLPTSLRVDASLPEADAQKILSYLNGGRLTKAESYPADKQTIISRHKPYQADGRFIITGDAGMSKPQLYGKVLRDLLMDQVRFIRDPKRRRLLERISRTDKLDDGRAGDGVGEVR